MLIHSVFFWLARDLTLAKRNKFHQALKKLGGIEVVKKIHIGPPALTKRPAVDRTYDVGLTVELKDIKAHQIYQDHPIHKKFLQDFSSYWIKVTIYDINAA